MNEEFRTHMLNAQGKDYALRIAQAFDKLIDELEMYCAGGREMALVRNHLEIACFYAKKAMAKENRE